MKPILFNTEMVRAILDGRKTVTRRVCHITINNGENVLHKRCCTAEFPANNMDGICAEFFDCNHWYEGAAKPPYRPDDILYVRETWAIIGTDGTHHKYGYKADNEWLVPMWRPSIHMPQEAARIFLRVTGVRVERLQDISVSGCIAEGIYWEDVTPNVSALPDNPAFDMDAVIASLQEAEEQRLIRNSYGSLWDSTIKSKDRSNYGWEANPWVWVIEFERCDKPVRE